MRVDASTIAIKIAILSGDLRIEKRYSERFREHFWAISDKIGIIETHLSEEDVTSRVEEVRSRLFTAPGEVAS